jgi:hypothetical protein
MPPYWTFTTTTLVTATQEGDARAVPNGCRAVRDARKSLEISTETGAGPVGATPERPLGRFTIPLGRGVRNSGPEGRRTRFFGRKTAISRVPHQVGEASSFRGTSS